MKRSDRELGMDRPIFETIEREIRSQCAAGSARCGELEVHRNFERAVHPGQWVCGFDRANRGCVETSVPARSNQADVLSATRAIDFEANQRVAIRIVQLRERWILERALDLLANDR